METRRPKSGRLKQHHTEAPRTIFRTSASTIPYLPDSTRAEEFKGNELQASAVGQ
jgi:hypothetical protein